MYIIQKQELGEGKQTKNDYTEKSLEKDFGSNLSKMLEDIGKNVRQMHKSKLMMS